MNDSHFEQRLRQGLASAADALPATELQPPEPVGRRRPFVAVAAAAAILVGGVAAVSLASGGSDPEEPDITASQDGASETEADGETTAAVEPGEVRRTNGQIPGEAVVVDDEIRFYGPDGTQTGSRSIAPLENARGGASSDLDGGVVVCGSDGVARFPDDFDPDDLELERGSHADDEPASPTTTELADDLEQLDPDAPELPDADVGGISPGYPDQLIWFPDGEDPVVLDDYTYCDSVAVVDSERGPIVVRATGGIPVQTPALEATVLATGETFELGFSLPGMAPRSSMTTDRVLVPSGGSVQLYDVATGDLLGTTDLGVDDWAFFSLAPDGESVAVADGDPMGEGPITLSVFDLATGEALYHEDQLYADSYMPSEGLQLSYDGTKVAVGNYYDGAEGYPDYGPVTVVDITSGDQYTIDAHGRLL